MKKIVFYHINDSEGWNDILGDQLSKMSESGLLDAADEVHLCTNGNPASFIPAQQALAEYKNVHWHHLMERVDFWEWPTLEFLRRYCVDNTEEFYVCYLHLKGLSRRADPNVIDWRNYMDYWQLERWEDCVAALDNNYDTVGANFIEAPWQHYHGNFWWARASYIRKLKPLQNPLATPWGTHSPYTNALYDPGNFRYDHEAWIGSENPVWFELHTSPGKQDQGWHFRNQYPRDKYATS